jgi:hypothetical protein
MVSNLRTPKAAAIAGIVFSGLLIAITWRLRVLVPDDPLEPGAWLKTNTTAVELTLNLVPFTGIAFLWFLGVLRDRLADREDKFFATVFFGSGLMFLAMLFVSAATIGSIIFSAAVAPNQMINSATFHFARSLAYNLTNLYAIKMAAVFMFSTSTACIYTNIAPRWIAISGYALALVLLLGSYHISLSPIVFPMWVLLLSLYILVDNVWWNRGRS